MEYIKIENDKYTNEDIKRVCKIMKSGGVVIVPTDTVYGIACDASNKKAVRKIYDIKRRDYTKPCNILVSDINMIKKVTKAMSEIEERIINKFFPGALTMIFHKNEVIPQIVSANLDTIGVRMPDNKFLLDVINNFGRPIVATSMNLSGEASMTRVDNLPKEIIDNVNLIVDSGESKIGVASTIIKVNKKNIIILREGPIKKEELEEVLN